MPLSLLGRCPCEVLEALLLKPSLLIAIPGLPRDAIAMVCELKKQNKLIGRFLLDLLQREGGRVFLRRKQVIPGL